MFTTSIVLGFWLYFCLWGFVLVPSTTRFSPFSWAVFWRWLSRPMVRSVTAALTPVSIQPLCPLFPQELHYLGFVLVTTEPCDCGVRLWCASQVSLLKHPNGLQLCPEPTASAPRVHPRYQIQVSLNISDIILCLEGNLVASVFICTF